jgi:hypothetical protein
VLLLALAVAGTRASGGEAAATCTPAQVHYEPYPGHGKGLSGIPWIAGGPRSRGMVALLWYWPNTWKRSAVHEARIYTGGHAPGGWNTKVLWAFLDPSAQGRDGGDAQVTIRGTRLDGRRTFRAQFAPIGYEGQDGAPSYASIIEVPTTGCWRLTATVGELKGSVVVRAVRR